MWPGGVGKGRICARGMGQCGMGMWYGTGWVGMGWCCVEWGSAERIGAGGGWAGHGVTSDPVTRPTSAIDQVSLCPASPGIAASPVSACGHVKVSASARAGSLTASARHRANVCKCNGRSLVNGDVLCPPVTIVRHKSSMIFKNSNKKQYLVPKTILMAANIPTP